MSAGAVNVRDSIEVNDAFTDPFAGVLMIVFNCSGVVVGAADDSFEGGFVYEIQACVFF